MHDPFLDSTTLDGQARIREYVLGWLERLDYRGRLDREWSAEELGALIWGRVEEEFAAHWAGRVVTNRAIAGVIATVMVEDYFERYPRRRESRYTVAGPFSDARFRRCVLDFLHDFEEFEPAALPSTPESAVAAFWDEVRTHPRRWGCSDQLGPFVDDLPRAREVALETVRDYFGLLHRAAEMRGEADAG